MTEHEQQVLFGATAEPMSVAAQVEQARKCTSRQHAWRMCVDASGLEHKQIYGALGVDQGKFSKYYGGSAFPDPDKLFALMDICGNEIPLRYDALVRNYELKPIQTELEEQLASAQQEITHLKAALKIVAGQR